jgi:hypothetical protein
VVAHTYNLMLEKLKQKDPSLGYIARPISKAGGAGE